MPKPKATLLHDPCVECGQQVTFELGEYASDFGQIYSTAGLKAYITTGQCELCGDYSADFALMGRKEELWWDQLPTGGVDTPRPGL